MKPFNSILVFLIIFIIISVGAGCYYYNRVIDRSEIDKGQICYSDFRVFWLASYHLYHHILKVWDTPKGYPTFRPFWFLNSELRRQAVPTARPGEYAVYRKDDEFYHFRYSPFVAFIMIPIGKISPPGDALIIWYLLLNIAFLTTILLMANQLKTDFGLSHKHYLLILWATFLMSLRFYLTNISLGQTDILVALFFAIFFMAYMKNRDIFCGIMLGLILQFKLFFLPILAYFLLIGRMKIVLFSIIGILLFLSMPSYVIGLGKMFELLRDWIDILGMSIPSQILNVKNHSLISAIGGYSFLKSLNKDNANIDIAGSSCLINIVCLLVSYLIIARAKRGVKKEDRRRFEYAEISMLIILSLLFSPITWVSHFVTLLIPICAAIYFAMTIKRKLLYTALGGFFILSCMIGTDFTNFIPRLHSLGILSVSAGVISLASALVYGYKESVKTL